MYACVTANNGNQIVETQEKTKFRMGGGRKVALIGGKKGNRTEGPLVKCRPVKKKRYDMYTQNTVSAAFPFVGTRVCQ